MVKERGRIVCGALMKNIHNYVKIYHRGTIKNVGRRCMSKRVQESVRERAHQVNEFKGGIKNSAKQSLYVIRLQMINFVFFPC